MTLTEILLAAILGIMILRYHSSAKHSGRYGKVCVYFRKTLKWQAKRKVKTIREKLKGVHYGS